MERVYRVSNSLYIYLFLLVLTALLLAFEAFQRLRTGDTGWGAFILVLALAWVGCAVAVYLRWCRLRIGIRSDSLTVTGDGPEKRLAWTDVERVREFRGPAYQLALRGLLPGPYLPHGLFRGETVLALQVRGSSQLLFRQSLIDSYGAFRQEVVRSLGRDVGVDLHARWWRLDDPTPIVSTDDLKQPPPLLEGEIPEFRRADVFRRRQSLSRTDRAGGGGYGR
jgi:hypothetical protein